MSSEFISYTFGKLIEDFRKLIQAGIAGVVNEMIEKKFAEIEDIKSRIAEVERIVGQMKASSNDMNQRIPSSDKVTTQSLKGSNICQYEGCSNPSISRGYCKNHYYMLKRKRVLANLNDKSPQKCSMEGCERIAISKGFCKNHYYQFKRGTIIQVDGRYIKRG